MAGGPLDFVGDVEVLVDERADAQGLLDACDDLGQCRQLADDAIRPRAAAYSRPAGVAAAGIRADGSVWGDATQLPYRHNRFDFDKINVDEYDRRLVSSDLVEHHRFERGNDAEPSFREHPRQERCKESLRFDDSDGDRSHVPRWAPDGGMVHFI